MLNKEKNTRGENSTGAKAVARTNARGYSFNSERAARNQFRSLSSRLSTERGCCIYIFKLVNRENFIKNIFNYCAEYNF